MGMLAIQKIKNDIVIPSIRLIQEGDTYRIMWHSLDVNGRYKTMRHGRNEEFYANASVFAGKNAGRWQIYFR